MILSDNKQHNMVKLDGQLHIDIFCPKCGAEMTELEFNRESRGGSFVWTAFRKCPKCGNKTSGDYNAKDVEG